MYFSPRKKVDVVHENFVIMRCSLDLGLGCFKTRLWFEGVISWEQIALSQIRNVAVNLSTTGRLELSNINLSDELSNIHLSEELSRHYAAVTRHACLYLRGTNIIWLVWKCLAKIDCYNDGSSVFGAKNGLCDYVSVTNMQGVWKFTLLVWLVSWW